MEILKDGKPRTRDQLSLMIERPRTTVYGYLEKLLDARIIFRFKFVMEKRKKGRPTVFFTLQCMDTEKVDPRDGIVKPITRIK